MEVLKMSASYVLEAEKYISEMTESFLFEESGGSNKSLASKAGGALKKAYDTIINALKTLSENIREFISKIFMSAEAKAKFKEYEEYMKNNPETANKKVTVKDFKKMDDAYLNAIKLANQKRRENADKSEGQKILDSLKVVGAGAAITVGAGAAFKMLSENKKVSEVTANLMNKFSKELEPVRDAIGKDTYDEGKAKLEEANKRSWWDTFTFGLLKKKEANNQTAMKELFGVIKSVVPGTKEHNDPNKEGNNLKRMGKIVQAHPKAAGKALEMYGTMKNLKHK